MARKSKKKKKAINWTSVVWTLFVVNVLAGLFFSPITSTRHLRVLGAQPHDINRITSLAENLSGKPFGKVDAAGFESQILAPRDVYDAKLSHNIFGSAMLKVQYRKPVAVLASLPHTYLDDQGVIFGSPEDINGLRPVALDQEYMQPGVAFALAWPSQILAGLCIKLDSFTELKGAAVHLDTTGRLLISRNDGHAVDLGGTDQLDEKLSKLRSMLEEDPQLLDKALRLSLADPAHPAFKAGTSNKSQ